MKVLHVITGLAAGGAEHQLRLLLRHLPLECEVATLSNPGSVATSIRSAGTPVHVMSMRSNRDISVVPQLAQLMRTGRYDVVHTHLYRACVHGRVAARLAGVPHVVATEHSLGEGLIEGHAITPGVRALYLATERLGDTTIAVSDTVARRLAAWGVPRGRISVIPNGIEAAEFQYDPALRRTARQRLGIAARARVVGGVGRLEPTKRFDCLIRAMSTLPEATLLLVGDGPARSALEELARELGVSSRVVFAGATAHVREMLCAMDVFASPSDQETFGLAVLEALASGLPTLYVTCPCLDELAPAAAPGASRCPSDQTALSASLEGELTRIEDRGATRLQVPPAVFHYDIGRLAQAVQELYHRLPARSVRTVPCPRPGK